MQDTIFDMLISPFEPFPMRSWWRRALRSGGVCLDGAGRYDKAGFRNQYLLAGPQGVQVMSVPLQGGRDQKPAMGTLRICGEEAWQVRHLRTIHTLYGNAPFFGHYRDSLEEVFYGHEYLWQFSRAGIDWLIRSCRIPLEATHATQPLAAGPRELDLRRWRKAERRDDTEGLPDYIQVFSDRTPFASNLSALDMLFCEGPDWWRSL